MARVQATQAQAGQQDAGTGRIARLGGWLFRHRTWLPLPIAIVLALVPVQPAPWQWLTGAVLVIAGEGLRLWGVHHIGAISRTRTDRLGPLVASGPFARVRNPLYLGNLALWVGFAVAAGARWIALGIAVLLALQYHAIVRWEEGLLESRLGDRYRDYAARVPRWLPRRLRVAARSAEPSMPQRFVWRDTLFSERGTFVAIAAGFALLWLKSQA